MENKLVVQSNILIEARYKQTYTVQELRTVLWVISEIHKKCFFGKNQQYEHKVIEISVKKYAEIMGIEVDNVYRDAQKIADGLGSKRFTIKTPTGWINLGWISSMEYIRGSGIIRVLIAPDLIPYIMALKPYTAFKLENILSLNSSHAIKIYQLLVQYKISGERVISIDELRSILGIADMKAYKSYGAIKRRILEISKNEINTKTDINISYTENKPHKKVESIKFKITEKKHQA
jgi:plasmid replication initiation protein